MVVKIILASSSLRVGGVLGGVVGVNAMINVDGSWLYMCDGI